MRVDAVIEDFLTDKGKARVTRAATTAKTRGGSSIGSPTASKYDDVYDGTANISLISFNFSNSIETATFGEYRLVLRCLGMKPVGRQEAANVGE